MDAVLPNDQKRSSASQQTVKHQPLNRRVIVVSTIGNALEWYDFVVFAFVAPIIAKQFFPSDNPTAAMLATWASFGVGFLTRPLGGILLGAYADKHGRKSALVITISLMAVGVGIIACAPTYAQISIWAPILMLIGRFFQGFSAGGEVGSATSLLVEYAPKNQRAIYGSYQMVSQGFSMLLGGLTGIATSQLLTTEQMESFGWRIPFFVGLLIVPVGLYVRKNLDESPVFEQAAAKATTPNKNPVSEVVSKHWRAVLQCIGMTIFSTVSVYAYFYYAPSYATKNLGMQYSDTVIASSVAASCFIVGAIASGYLSEAWGRKKPMLLSTVLAAVLAYPLYKWLETHPTLPVLIVVQTTLLLTLSLYMGSYTAVVCEIFPAKVRSTGLSISYNAAVMIFGGFAGAIVTYLIGVTGDKMSVVYYGLFGALVGFISVCSIADRLQEELL